MNFHDVDAIMTVFVDADGKRWVLVERQENKMLYFGRAPKQVPEGQKSLSEVAPVLSIRPYPFVCGERLVVECRLTTHQTVRVMTAPVRVVQWGAVSRRALCEYYEIKEKTS